MFDSQWICIFFLTPVRVCQIEAKKGFKHQTTCNWDFHTNTSHRSQQRNTFISFPVRSVRSTPKNVWMFGVSSVLANITVLVVILPVVNTKLSVGLLTEMHSTYINTCAYSPSLQLKLMQKFFTRIKIILSPTDGGCSSTDTTSCLVTLAFIRLFSLAESSAQSWLKKLVWHYYPCLKLLPAPSLSCLFFSGIPIYVQILA